MGCALVAALSASGLRISEILALEIDGTGDSYDPSAGTIHVRRTLKTPAAARIVFLPSDFTAWLNSKIPTRGRVFPFTYQQVREKLARLRLPNPHSFRHFRVTHLRTNGVLEDFIRNQAGHGARSTTDRYSHAAGNLEALRAEIERVGVGFKFAE